MLKKTEKNSIVEICPVRNVIARFGNKWALLIILVISEQNKVRFSRLAELIPDISPKVLSNTLKVLEYDGLISRTTFPEVPPRVEYSLTELGKELVPMIHELTAWAQKHKEKIIEHRNKFEKK